MHLVLDGRNEVYRYTCARCRTVAAKARLRSLRSLSIASIAKKLPSFYFLSWWEIDQDHVGAFFKTSEDYIFSIWRDVEVANEELSIEVG